MWLQYKLQAMQVQFVYVTTCRLQHTIITQALLLSRSHKGKRNVTDSLASRYFSKDPIGTTEAKECNGQSPQSIKGFT